MASDDASIVPADPDAAAGVATSAGVVVLVVVAGALESARPAVDAVVAPLAMAAGFIVLIGGGWFSGWSSAPPSSRTTMLLASRNSRRILPVARITSGRFSGGITISATASITMISTMPKLDAQRENSGCSRHRHAAGVAPIQPPMIVNAGRGVKP